MTESALVWIVLTPLLCALLVLATGRWPNLRETMSLITGGALIVQVVTLAPRCSRVIPQAYCWRCRYRGSRWRCR